MGLQILSQLFHPPPNCATLPIPRSIFSSILFILYTSHNNISDPWATWIHSNLLFSIRIPVENPRNLSIYSRVIDAYQELTFYDPSIFVQREWERERTRESERKRERERENVQIVTIWGREKPRRAALLMTSGMPAHPAREPVDTRFTTRVQVPRQCGRKRR